MKCVRTAALFLPLLLCTASRADSFSFTGSFSADNNVQAFTFSVGASSTVTLRSLSYAGGTNAAGQTIPRGGFDPILALFSGTGPTATYINQNDDGNALVPPDPLTGDQYDVYLQAVLGMGTYTVTIQQYDNFFNGSLGDPFSTGFRRDGAGNETFTANFGCTQGQFCDVSGSAPYDNRTPAWAFDITGVNAATQVGGTAVTPEPSSLLLLATGLAGTAGLLRRRTTA